MLSPASSPRFLGREFQLQGMLRASGVSAGGRLPEHDFASKFYFFLPMAPDKLCILFALIFSSEKWGK